MFCKNCGAKLTDDAKFCLNCGTKVAAEVSAPVIPAPAVPVAEPVEPVLNETVAFNNSFQIEKPSAPLPTSAPKKSGFKPYVLIIIILSVLLAFESGFIVYDKVFAADTYSESDDEGKPSKKNNSSSPALGDGSSLPSSSDGAPSSSNPSSSNPTSSEPIVSNGFESTDICGKWQLYSLTDGDGKELPQCFTFYSFNFFPDGTADVTYIKSDFSRDSYSIEWTYNFGNASGKHYYELADNKGNTYSLMFTPEKGEILMEYLLENDDSEFHYYQRVN